MEPALTTIFPTPNYPNCWSGHACASTAISEVLADQLPAAADVARSVRITHLGRRLTSAVSLRKSDALRRKRVMYNMGFSFQDYR
jgi:hypothetical protein